MTQHEAIIQYLKSHPEGLTMFSGFTELGQTKINSRISELRDMGYTFQQTWESANRKRWLRYRLLSEPMQMKIESDGQMVLA